MAAELLLTFTMEETLTRVGSIAAEGIRLAWGLEGQLRKLKQSLIMIRDVLQDAARRSVTDDSVKGWLEKLQDVAYDAEDVLDEFAYEILRKDQKKGKVRDCFSLHNPVAFRLNMGQKVKEINGALDEIRKDAAVFQLTSLHVDRAQEVSWDQDRQTDSFIDSSEIVGREDDVSIVMDMLTVAIVNIFCQPFSNHHDFCHCSSWFCTWVAVNASPFSYKERDGRECSVEKA